MFKHNCQLRCVLLHTVNWYLPVRKMNTHHACQFVCVVTFTVQPAQFLSVSRRFWCNRLPTQYNLCISTKHCLSRQIFAFQYDIGFKFIVFSVHSTSSSSVCLLEQCCFSFHSVSLYTIAVYHFDGFFWHQLVNFLASERIKCNIVSVAVLSTFNLTEPKRRKAIAIRGNRYLVAFEIHNQCSLSLATE